MIKINIDGDACSYRVSDHTISTLYMIFSKLVERKQQSMKEQTIAAQLQSQTTCSCILHLPPATKIHSS